MSLMPVTDIAILGAGPTGLALACALAGSPFRVTLIDAADAGRHVADPRALALSEGSRHLLDRLGAWPNAQSSPTPIRTIRVSQQGGPGETHLRAEEEKIEALGYVTAYRDLVGALLARLDAGNANPTEIRWSTRVVGSQHVDGPPIGRGRKLELSDGRTLFARLVVHAEGASDDGAFLADYDQCAIVCEASPDAPHDNTAQERFTPDGPLALLPLGAAYSVVCVVPTTKRDATLALDDDSFSALLAEKMDGRIAFASVTPRAAFPLRLRLRKRLAEGREAWIGNAAQTLHPVSGQGFNLALRDAWTLADRLLECRDASALRDHLLADWAHSRQTDRLGSAAFTDGIVRLFSNDLAPLATTRGAGLAMLDRLPFARHFIARRMIFGARGW
jgi:2-octaprenyl-6-methoxyphenol hydroxylase